MPQRGGRVDPHSRLARSRPVHRQIATTWVLTHDRFRLCVCRVPARRTPRPDWVLPHRVALGHRIAELRRKAGLSQDQLAKLVGVDRRTIQRYENAERDPQFSDLLLIAHALGVLVADLLR
ncbi:helix-turn-helix transcriptional regulator [Streptomyces sp. NPDC046821]|uniref:helix-turn-helix transcriptional regulator n=1 Tax=Streptomyces sp. NPDC046821 TaxID=3154702 RepID=UPI0033F984DC